MVLEPVITMCHSDVWSHRANGAVRVKDGDVHISDSYCFMGEKWSERETRQRKQNGQRGGGGQWYVRNAAKANTKPPLTLLSLMKSMQPTFPVQRPHRTRTVAQYTEPTAEVGSSGASAVLNLN